jgi:2'-5' RNA ligase
MRLFIALDLDDPIRERICRFVESVQGFVPDARWTTPESLHVTLEFIGEHPDPAAEQIQQTLESIQANAAEIQFRGYGFFPTPKSARVFWIGMEADPQLAALAATIADKMASFGIPKEDHPFRPHLTLARAGGRSGSPRRHKGDSPSHTFQRLQEKLSALPSAEFGTMTARKFFLYRSQLSPQGSRYTKLAGFALQ